MLEVKLVLIKKPYPSSFDSVQYPAGFRLPHFIKFNGDNNKSTFEHISQYLAQLGEAGSISELKVRLFSLSLIGTTFSWFSSLAPNLGSWEQLEQKFKDYFFCKNYELKLSHLTSVKQIRDESVNDYIRRFCDTKNRCFSVNTAEKDLADLAFSNLCSHIKERLEGYDFFTITQVHQRALDVESRSKESQKSHKHHRPNMHTLECNSDC